MQKVALVLGTLFIHVLFFIVCMQSTQYQLMLPDSQEYCDVAQQVLQGNGFADGHGVAQAYRLPGYPLFLAGCGGSITMALLVQIIISSFIPLLVYMFSLALFPDRKRMALASGMCAMLHTGFLLYSCMLTTEILFMVLWLGFLCALLNKRLGWAGGVLGVLSLVRPVGHFLCVLLVGVKVFKKLMNGSRAFMNEVHELQDDKKFQFLLSYLIPVAPWLIRNYLIFGAIFFHTLPGLHFVKYTATPIIAQSQNIDIVTAYGKALQGWHDASDVHDNEYQRCRDGERYTLSLIKEHPWLFIKNSLKQMIKTCCSLYSAQLLFVGSIATVWHSEATTLWDKAKRFLVPSVKDVWVKVFIWIDAIQYIFFALGSCAFLGYAVMRRSLWPVLATIVPFMLLFVGLTLSYGCARLRLPLEPFMILMTCWWVRER